MSVHLTEREGFRKQWPANRGGLSPGVPMLFGGNLKKGSLFYDKKRITIL